jgi:hypothetical protein
MMGLDGAFLLRWLRLLTIAAICGVGIGYLVAHLAISPALSFDGRLYAAAARAWLEGADPWSVEIDGIGFAAPPSALLAAAPLAMLPPELVGPVTVTLAAVCAVIAIRLARAGWWWLLSIPVLEGVLVGSLDLLVAALLIWAVRGTASRPRLVGASVAVLAKVYAIVPALALGHRRIVFAGVLALALTAPILPWRRFIELSPELWARLVEQAGQGMGSPWVTPWLVPPTIVALVVIGRRDGAWLLVPALWPATQVHYSVFMIPVGSPVLAAVILLPLPAPAALAVIALALVRGWQRRLDPWSWVPDRWRRAPDAGWYRAAD